MSDTKTPAWEIGVARRLSPALYRALGDPNRLALLVRLAASPGPLTVTELTDCCGVHLSGVSRHLSLMRAAGLVRAERRGRTVLYSLDADTLTARLRGLADAIDSCRAACAAEDSGCCSGSEPQ